MAVIPNVFEKQRKGSNWQVLNEDQTEEHNPQKVLICFSTFPFST